MDKLAVLKQKLHREWESKKVIHNFLDKGDLFPYKLPLKKYTAKAMLDDFQTIQIEIQRIADFSKSKKYPLIHRPLALAKLGEQKVPDYFLLSESDFLQWTGKTTEFNDFKNVCLQLKTHPQLLPVFKSHPFLILENIKHFALLISIVEWFKGNDNKNLYLRQISLKNIDTKFIEKNKKIIALMLDCCLEKEQINSKITDFKHHGFEKRYGLNYPKSRIRIRILDTALTIQGLDDLEITPQALAQLNIKANTVYITENKINGLCFPPMAKSIVIFGLGYGVNKLTAIPWLKGCQIKYWGDIDTHGFTMLSQLRQILPQTQSLLMDEQTLLKNKRSWVTEAKQQTNAERIVFLTAPEKALYKQLINNTLGNNIRLEQEFLSFKTLLTALNA